MFEDAIFLTACIPDWIEENILHSGNKIKVTFLLSQS